MTPLHHWMGSHEGYCNLQNVSQKHICTWALMEDNETSSPLRQHGTCTEKERKLSPAHLRNRGELVPFIKQIVQKSLKLFSLQCLS